MSDRSLTLAESCAVRSIGRTIGSSISTSLSERTANLLPRTAGTGGVKSASNASITLSGAVHSS